MGMLCAKAARPGSYYTLGIMRLLLIFAELMLSSVVTAPFNFHQHKTALTFLQCAVRESDHSLLNLEHTKKTQGEFS